MESQEDPRAAQNSEAHERRSREHRPETKRGQREDKETMEKRLGDEIEEKEMMERGQGEYV